MKRKLSSRLSPQAKKVVLQAPESMVSGILELSKESVGNVAKAIQSLGGTVRSNLDEANTLTFDVEAANLEKIADVEGVVYVSVREHYQN